MKTAEQSRFASGLIDKAPLERLRGMLKSLELAPLSPLEADQLAEYLAVLLRWNAKLNLTAIRDVETILQRHFCESIQCARSIPMGVRTLLDFGSGGGFPGVPCAICRPEISVTLAESQGKKASFLQEVARTLRLHVAVHVGRVENMPRVRMFDTVTLRAVDRMNEACEAALQRVRPGGWIMILTTKLHGDELAHHLPGVSWHPTSRLAGTTDGQILVGQRLI